MNYLAAPTLYDWPEIRRETDACWHSITDALRACGVRAPPALTRDRSVEDLWNDPGLLLGQTCGYPFVTRLRNRVRLVGTPCYAVDGCDGPYYRSFVVARRSHKKCSLRQLRGLRVAINGRDSQSGYSALRRLIAPLAEQGRFFSSVLTTGSHRGSMRAVADGRADVCAVDAVCWALAARHDPAVQARLIVIAETPPTPGLPLICASSVAATVMVGLRASVTAVLRQGMLAATRHALCIGGIGWVPEHAYRVILRMETEAVALGYSELA